MNKLDHVKLLINSGANPNILQEDGFSPLHAAVIRQNILIVKYLLINGGNPNTKTKVYNQSPVHIAIKNNIDPMILLLLVQFNGSLLDRDKFDKDSNDDEGNNDIRAVGGMVLQYWSKVIIQLERGEETNQRIATLKRHRSIGEGRQAVFRITSRGIS